MAKAVRLPVLAGVLTLVAGCATSSASPVNDHAKVVQALMTLLSADNRKICVDGSTSGTPLAIYRAMLAAPEPAKRPLAWHTPVPLRTPRPLSERQIFDDEFAADRVLLALPTGNAERLPQQRQSQFDAAARSLLLAGNVERVHIADSPTVRSKWWGLNRLWPECTTVYTVSNPVVGGKIAFVSVGAGHWGTTYAFERNGSTWSPTAQWTNWLY